MSTQVFVETRESAPSSFQRAWIYTLVLVLGTVAFGIILLIVRAPVQEDVVMRQRHVRRRQNRREKVVQAGDFVSKSELMALHCVAIVLHTLSGLGGYMIARSGDVKVRGCPP